MKLHRAPLILALAALTLVACGDDDDEPTVTEADVTVPDVSLPDDVTIPSLPDISLPDVSLPDISLPDVSLPDAEDAEEFVRDGLADLGLNDDQIDCLLEQIDVSSGQAPDVNEMIDLFDDCDIDIADLQPGG